MLCGGTQIPEGLYLTKSFSKYFLFARLSFLAQRAQVFLSHQPLNRYGPERSQHRIDYIGTFLYRGWLFEDSASKYCLNHKISSLEASEMTRRVKPLATKPDEMTLVIGTHVVERGN